MKSHGDNGSWRGSETPHPEDNGHRPNTVRPPVALPPRPKVPPTAPPPKAPPRRGQSEYLAFNALNLDHARSAKMINALNLDGLTTSPPVPTVTVRQREKNTTAARAAVTFAEIACRRQEKQRRATESLLPRTAERVAAATVERVAASESAPAGAATVTEQSMTSRVWENLTSQQHIDRAEEWMTTGFQQDIAANATLNEIQFIPPPPAPPPDYPPAADQW